MPIGAAGVGGEQAANQANPDATVAIAARQPGKGKGGNFWRAGHRSLSFAAAVLAHTCDDSDDSIDIVLR